jgi:hypothetical protein
MRPGRIVVWGSCTFQQRSPDPEAPTVGVPVPVRSLGNRPSMGRLRSWRRACGARSAGWIRRTDVRSWRATGVASVGDEGESTGDRRGCRTLCWREVSGVEERARCWSSPTAIRSPGPWQGLPANWRRSTQARCHEVGQPFAGQGTSNSPRRTWVQALVSTALRRRRSCGWRPPLGLAS